MCATRYGGLLVTNGLIAYFNAGTTKSFVSGQSSVLDLSASGFTGALSGAVGWTSAQQGCWTFTQSGGIPTTLKAALGDFTVCAWFSGATGPIPGNRGNERICDMSYQSGFWMGRNAQNANTWGGGVQEGNPPFGIYVGGLTDGQPNMLTSIRAGTTHTIYGNGTATGVSNTVSSTPVNASVLFSIGTAFDSLGVPGANISGGVYMVSVYNRALSAAEVNQNFNATRSRFGL